MVVDVSQVTKPEPPKESLNYIEFYAPCCHSVRSCNAMADYVISLRTRRVLRTIEAVRCKRGIVKKYKFYPSNDVVLVSYYVSNRGVHHIKILWKPQNVTTEEVERAVRRALRLEEVVKIVVRDSTVEEVCEEE
jgi:hypothetical protein